MSGVCNETTHTCSPPACDDEVLNGEETAMDCGGSDCDPCVDEVACTTGTDCASGVCDDVTNTCVAPSCDDDVTNGAETDTDCGGGECDLCADNLDCTTDTDCHSGVCDTDLGTCSPPACDDEVMNGEETDVDCGGRICAACPVVGESCSRDNCAEGYCRWGTCEIGIDCLDVMENLGETEDGLYTIDPDGAAGAVAPFEAYCDMTSEGGGWTAIMRAYDNNFAYGDVVWTTAALFNETDYEFETAGLAKYEAFNSVPVFTLRTTDADDFSVGHEYNFEDQQLGALAVFSSTGFEIGTELIHYFNDRVPAGAQQWGCETYITYGFNQADYIGAGWTGGGGYCDWNGGARWGQRVNANHGGTGNHAGQGWGAFSLISVGSYTSPTGGFALQQVLWVRRAAHCADGTLSDGETDVDCGDECGTCPRGGTCVDDNDCAIGYCLDEVCTVPASCADMLAARDTATDGVYKVDFDGDDSELPADVFCDMTRDGGGWTLVGKVAAGDYTSMTDEDYINLVANPVDDVNPDLLQASTYPTAGQMAFLNRAKMNAMFAGSSVQTVRVDMTNNLVNGAANGTYYQARLDPPEDWDFWGAIRSSYLWSDETYTGGSSCTHDDGSVTQCYLGGAGETFILNKGDVYDADTDSFDNNTDGSFGWWSDENLTLVDGSTLLVTRHGGLMCDGFGNMGWQWLLTLDAGGDSRWKADTHRAQSLIWFK
jgi:hypothetical protein